MKLKTRIKIMVSILVAIVVLTNTTIISIYILGSLKKNAVQSTESVTEQTLITFDGLLGSIESMSRLPLIDSEIFGILNENYDEYDESIRKYKKYQDMDKIISKIGTEMMYSNSFIYAIAIFPYNTDLVYSKQRYGKRVHTEGLEEREWFRKVNATNGREVVILPKGEDDIYQDKREVISLARLLYNPMKEEKLGIIRIDIAVEDLETIWNKKNLMEGSEIVILNKQDELLYSSVNENERSISWTELKKTVKKNDKSKEINLNGKDKITILSESDTYGISALTFVLPDLIYKDAYITMRIIVVFALVCLFIAFIMTESISKQIMKPIAELNELMKAVRAGDLSVRSKVSAVGEFEEVCQSFNHMVENTENLIERIYKEQEEKREMEYRALQAQISPHFTLNTINTIQWLARMQGSTLIEQALDSLGNILTFAVREKKEKVSIKTEVEQMGYYINILSLRYYNKFDITMDVEDEVKNCYTIKYLLQTIVENSIFHGFDGMEKRGDIRVSIKRTGEKIVYEILDNGKGIEEERISQILSGEEAADTGRNKIGLFNINRRIQLIFGKVYGIHIESKMSEYTKVMVIIPAEEER